MLNSPRSRFSLPPGLSLKPDLSEFLDALLASFRPNYVTIAQWRNEVLLAYETHHVNTRIKMRTALREASAIADDLAGDGVASTELLTPAFVDRFAARPGRACSTNGLLASLRCAIKLAATRGYVEKDLVSRCRFRVKDRDVYKPRHHSQETIATVLNHLRVAAIDFPSRRLYAFASVLAYCGLRAGEAKRVRVEDVDLDRGFIFVRPNGVRLKTIGAEAPVPMPEALREILREWLPECKSEWLVPTHRRDKPWSQGSNGKRPGDALRDSAAAIGVSGFTPLSLRHSLATHLVGSHGLSRAQVKLILRHTTERTGNYYVHPDLVNLRENVRSFTFSRPSGPV